MSFAHVLRPEFRFPNGLFDLIKYSTVVNSRQVLVNNNSEHSAEKLFLVIIGYIVPFALTLAFTTNNQSQLIATLMSETEQTEYCEFYKMFYVLKSTKQMDRI